MTSTQITILLLVAQVAITFLIAFRAFARYFQTRHDLYLILGIAMGTIAIVGVVGIVGDNYFASSLNTKWFRYSAQVVSYTFIFLASLRASEGYLRRVVQWELICVALLAGALFLTPVTPALGNARVEALVSLSRGVICFIICLNYIRFFLQKGTRFSFLMGLAFFLISVGIAITTPWYFQQTKLLYLSIGDTTRTVGLFIMLLTFFLK
ncbi:MAG TPA: hypothetical protein VGD98_23645 [Ktedonobacteraceae bacterium]